MSSKVSFSGSGCDPNYNEAVNHLNDVGGGTPLNAAAAAGSKEFIEELLKVDGIDIELATDSGNRPIHQSARNGHLEVIKLLLEAGADVNARGKWNFSAALSAADYGKFDALKELFNHGADLDAQDTRWGNTPLIRATQRSERPIVKYRHIISLT